MQHLTVEVAMDGRPTALYIPHPRRGVMEELTIAAHAHRLHVVDVVWSWPDLVRVLAGGEAELGLVESMADLPPDRLPRLVAADELLPPPPDPTRPIIRW